MRKTLLWTVTLCLVVLASYLNLVSAAAQSKKRITVPAGTRILIRTVDAIDSSKQKTGFRFTATLETDLQAEDKVVAPRGTTVYGRLAQASSAGRMSGSSELTLELTDDCFRQLDLAPFDRFIWPHLLVNLLSAPGRSEALRRPEGDAFRA